MKFSNPCPFRPRPKEYPEDQNKLNVVQNSYIFFFEKMAIGTQETPLEAPSWEIVLDPS